MRITKTLMQGLFRVGENRTDFVRPVTDRNYDIDGLTPELVKLFRPVMGDIYPNFLYDCNSTGAYGRLPCTGTEYVITVPVFCHEQPLGYLGPGGICRTDKQNLWFCRVSRPDAVIIVNPDLLLNNSSVPSSSSVSCDPHKTPPSGISHRPPADGGM
jgi:hypothetical protein